VSSSAFNRAVESLALFALQAALWLALALAFAALLVVAGSQEWAEALRFSAVNWLPWVLLTPGVFWLTRRFPLERGRLLRGVPVHLAACAACTVLSLWIANEIAPQPSGGPGGRPSMGDRGGRFGGLPSENGPGGPGQEKGGHSGPSRLGDRPGGPPALPSDGGGGPRGFSRDDGHEPRFSRGGPPPGFMRLEPPGGFGFRDRFGPPFIAIALRANFGFAIYLIVATAAHALAFYRRAQERDRHALVLTASLNQAKLDALRLQLQPHFLFNTLNAISTLVHRDAAAADELIGDLSELLRLSLLTAAHEVPLARELELLDCYLAIEQARLGDRLTVARDIDPATTAALVPTFLLQPLVENAVRHGLEPRLAPGTITLHAHRDGDSLLLSVTDNGVGLAAGEDGRARHGIGLANTEARLRALHGDAAQLQLHALPAGGVHVEIKLPFRTAAATATS